MYGEINFSDVGINVLPSKVGQAGIIKLISVAMGDGHKSGEIIEKLKFEYVNDTIIIYDENKSQAASKYYISNDKNLRSVLLVERKDTLIITFTYTMMNISLILPK